MPLLQISGLTALHTTFNIAYYLLNCKTEDCFNWVFNCMKELLRINDISLRQVIISDYDKAFKKACRTSFNDGIQHSICLWNIMKNVAFNVKKKWEGQLEGTALGEQGNSGSHLPDEESTNGGFIYLAITDPVAQRVATWLLQSKNCAQNLRNQGRRHEEDPIMVRNTRRTCKNGHRQLIDEAWSPDSSGNDQESSRGTSASVRCDPSYDAVPRPRKRVKNMMTMEAIQLQQQQQINILTSYMGRMHQGLAMILNGPLIARRMDTPLVLTPSGPWTMLSGGSAPSMTPSRTPRPSLMPYMGQEGGPMQPVAPIVAGNSMNRFPTITPWSATHFSQWEAPRSS
jgi:hypothetical protein